MTYIAPVPRSELSLVAPSRAASVDPAISAADIMHLGELSQWLRQRLAIDASLSDQALLQSLAAVTGHGDRRERWRAAFQSPLGLWLAERGSDLNTALNTILAALPAPRC